MLNLQSTKSALRHGALAIFVCIPSFAWAEQLDAQAINQADASLNSRASVAKLQILLDRAEFSPGVIDGFMGENLKHALQAFRDARNIKEEGETVGPDTQSALGWKGANVAVEYKLTQDDVNGPFTKTIPSDFEAQRKLDRLGFTSPAEKLAERFHMDEDFLKELNRQADFGQSGSKILVADVPPSPQQLPDAQRIEVDSKLNQLFVFDGQDKIVAAFPATVGSEESPAPTGVLTVKGVADAPVYTYTPDLNFAGVNADEAFKIAPGPNNPVGSVWIDLSEDGYGIHGTPEPSEIGKTASHGCVRLTNWDANALAKMVRPGMKVLFRS